MLELPKNILVIGAGRSGVAATQFLAKHGVNVTLTDKNSIDKWSDIAKNLKEKSGVSLIGEMQNINPDNYDLAVISPGIPLTEPGVQRLSESGLPIWGELELAWRALEKPFVAITGTNGKTTTTSLVGYIFKAAGINTFVGGNIGIPLINAAEQKDNLEWVVAEISSFQLETAFTFAPKVAAVLNLTPDHLDRHGNMEGYGQVKEKMFAAQGLDDVVVLNYDNDYTRAMAYKAHGKICYFSRQSQLSNGVYVSDGELIIADNGKHLKVIDSKDIFIRGEHNLENALAAVAICYHAGIAVDVIAEGLRSFRGVEHRQEWVCEKNGVTFINDSKGTNPDSTIQALKAYDNQILILGGYDKGGTFEALLPLIHEHVKGVVVIGATADKIKQTLLQGGFTNIKEAGNDFALAVNLASEMAVPGDVVMLSPACASWDMFPNFETRGELFKKLVMGE